MNEKSVYVGPYLEIHRTDKQPDAWKFTDEVKEAFSTQGSYDGPVMLFVPNFSREAPREYWERADPDLIHETKVLPINAVEVGEDIAWLEKAFAGELEVARTTYGKDNVMVQWGIVVDVES